MAKRYPFAITSDDGATPAQLDVVKDKIPGNSSTPTYGDFKVYKDSVFQADIYVTSNLDGLYYFEYTESGIYEIRVGSLGIGHTAQDELKNIYLVADDGLTEADLDDVTLEYDSANGVQVKALGIDTAQIAADAITGAKIADNAVDTEHITADAITGAEIADNAIDSEHYVDGSIDTVHLAADAVDHDKITALDFLQLAPVSTAPSAIEANEGKIFYRKNTVAASPKTYGLYVIIASPNGGYSSEAIATLSTIPA